MTDRPLQTDYPVAGVRIDVFDESAPVRVRVRSATELADWIPFVSDPTRDESGQVATTVEYRGGLYAIAKRQRTASGWQYDLTPWPQGEVVRRKRPLSRKYFAHIEAEKRDETKQKRRDLVVRGLGFLIAFLPASTQERVSETYDYDAAGWTKVSSAVLGLLALGLTVICDVILPLAQSYGAAYAGATIGWPGTLLWPYFVIDSFIRFGTAIAAEKPLGLLPLELVDWLVRTIRQSARGSSGKSSSDRE